MKKAQFISFFLVLILSNSSFAQYFIGPFNLTNKKYYIVYEKFFKGDEKVLKTWYHYTVSFSKKDKKYILRLFQPEKHILLSETRYLDKNLQIKDGLSLKLDYSNYYRHIGNYKNNLEEGSWKTIDTIGNIRSIYTYVEGKKQGSASNFYENNILKEKFFYLNDSFDGKYEKFHKNGKLAEEGFYKESKKDGEYKVYDSTGVQSEFFVFSNDKIVKSIIYNSIENKDENMDLILDKSDVSPCFIYEEDQNENINFNKNCDLKNMFKYIGRYIRFPANAQSLDIKGKVLVRFVIEKNGDVGEIKVMSALCNSLEEETIRVIRILPKWKPALQNGVAVRVYVNTSFIYNLE